VKAIISAVVSTLLCRKDSWCLFHKPRFEERLHDSTPYWHTELKIHLRSSSLDASQTAGKPITAFQIRDQF